MGIYKNVMELLVEEEVERQFKALPPRIASYVKPVELVAYALNQLPALYATSEKGLSLQLKQGKERYSPQITQAVQRALAAISRDPLRTAIPLQDQQSTPLREVLHQMRLLLRNDKVNWENLPIAVEQALMHASQTGTTRSSRHFSQARQPSRSSSPYLQRLPLRSPASSEQNPQPTIHPNNPDSDNIEPFGWDDPFYHSH